MSRKVLIVAPFGKPEMTSWLIARAFNCVGIAAERFDYRNEGLSYGWETMNASLKAMIDKLPKGSIVLIIKGDMINPLVFQGRWDLKRVLWFFDFDAFEPHEYLFKLGRWMTHVFLSCYPWVEKLRERGVNAFFLPQATDPTVYIPLRSKKTCDIAFIGTKKLGRTEVLESLGKEFSLEVWGEQWQGTKFKPGKPAYLNEFCKAVAQARIILNVTPSASWPIYEKTFSQRIYMATACEACLLTDDIPGIENFFTGKELIVYHEDSLFAQIRFLLRNDKMRERIGQAARTRVLKEHQYIHRLKEMFTCLGLSLSHLKNSRESARFSETAQR